MLEQENMKKKMSGTSGSGLEITGKWKYLEYSQVYTVFPYKGDYN